MGYTLHGLRSGAVEGAQAQTKRDRSRKLALYRGARKIENTQEKRKRKRKDKEREKKKIPKQRDRSTTSVVQYSRRPGYVSNVCGDSIRTYSGSAFAPFGVRIHHTYRYRGSSALSSLMR